MNKIKFFVLGLLLLFCALLFKLPTSTIISLPALPPLTKNASMLLVPLDSRPVCSKMVQKLGSLAGINVIVPPKALLDNYQQPADRKKLWQWLQRSADAYTQNVISADILLHGSLLQSRRHIAAKQEQQEFFAQLQALQNKLHPTLENASSRLTLFSVIPRLLVSDEIYPDCWYQFHLMRYSQLLDMTEINSDYVMTKKLLEYQEFIPQEILAKYLNIYKQSQSFNEQLTAQSTAHNATQIIIGQDDSSPFGLPHRSALQLEKFIAHHKLANVQLTYGADEIAALLLARYFVQQTNRQPKIFLQYSSPAVEFKYMPYMAVSTSTALRSQIELIGAQSTAAADTADIILYIHCGDDNLKPTTNTVNEVQALLNQAKPVALIDLSANFAAEEMLLPQLLANNVPVNKLAAYAAWNTFSNSSGTALAQSVIFAGRLRQLQQQQNSEQIAALYAENLRFTCERILEDFVYQKLIHPRLRPYLASFGITPTNLLAEDKQTVEYYIQKRLSFYALLLLQANLGRTPFYSAQDKNYYLKNLLVGAQLPWNRIFEVDLTVHTQTEAK